MQSGNELCEDSDVYSQHQRHCHTPDRLSLPYGCASKHRYLAGADLHQSQADTLRSGVPISANTISADK